MDRVIIEDTRLRRLLDLTPLLGLLSVVTLSYLQKLYFGMNPLQWNSYIVPSLLGLLGGLMLKLLGRYCYLCSYRSQLSATQLEDVTLRHELYLDSVEDGLCEVDEQGRCRLVNDAATKMFGYRRDELLGQDLCLLLHNRDRQGHPCDFTQGRLFKTLMSGLTGVLNNETFWRKDGSWFAARVKHHPLENGALLVFRNITSDKIIQRQLAHARSGDAVTNESSLRKKIALLVEGAIADRGIHAMFFVDLDRFKVINQTIGYSVGDLLLEDFYSYLTAVVKARGVTGRVSGDQFAVLMRDCTLDSAHRFGEELLAFIDRFTFSWQQRTFKVSASIGYCMIDCSTPNADAVLIGADAACATAKDAGRRRCHRYDPTADEYREQRSKMDAVPQIQQALDNDLFFLRRQAIAPLNNEGAKSGFEVLVALRDEQGGVVAPGAFLPAAERYDLMPDIDRWVVRRIFSWLGQQPQQAAEVDFISINLSGKSFNNAAFLPFLKQAIAGCPVPPRQLCFEITETAAMENKQQALQFIDEIKQLGCRFALDDFGSGMSSFGYLKSFPADFIKIDGSFVKDMVNDPLSRQIVESLHNISRLLGIKTIAEHAEDEQTLQLLKQIGIDYVQGYVIERPRTID